MLMDLLTKAVHRTMHFIGVRRRHSKATRKTASCSFTARRLICHAHCSKHSAWLDLIIE